MREPITRFRNEYKFLSNFFPADVEFEGDVYHSVEHAYQAAKSTLRQDRCLIRGTKKAGAAKYQGKFYISLRPGWEDMKLEVMLLLLRQKFTIPALRDALLATGDAELIEGNYWGDFYWGVCEGVGKNHLGKLLMQVREEIRKNA
jgi:ribA/ribD-fused uncharacterized protein